MINFYVMNYSKLSDAVINDRIIKFIKYLEEKGLKNNIKIEYCGESLKNRLLKFIDNKDYTLIDNHEFLLELNSYVGAISNHINIRNYKFIFIGEQLYTRNEWGEANNWIAVIKNCEEKVIWHEIAHLIGANDHYDMETHETLNICTNPLDCIMTFGKLQGELCSESLREITKDE